MRGLEAHLVHEGVLRARHEVVVAGGQRVHEAQLGRAAGQPVFAGGHLLHVQRRAVRLHEVLEERVRLLELLLQLGAALLRHLAENGDGAFELAGGHLLDVHVMLLEQLSDIGNLRHHADGADDGEGRGDDAVGDTRHHVAARRGDTVDAHRQLHLPLLQARQLRRRQPVVRHRAAR
jgi:hypothetical protein